MTLADVQEAPGTELVRCWWNDETNSGATVGTAGVTRIVLRADGCGLSGYYDRIHVFNENGRHLVFPAHHVGGWEVKP